jgi:hypothetical protein
MADWIDTLYENNWHEMPELDVEKIERSALQQGLATIRDQESGRWNDAMLAAQQFYAGYLATVEDIMHKLRTGTLSPEHFEEMREAQRKEQRGRYPGT